MVSSEIHRVDGYDINGSVNVWLDFLFLISTEDNSVFVTIERVNNEQLVEGLIFIIHSLLSFNTFHHILIPGSIALRIWVLKLIKELFP